ncbi:tetratricopeptide repeat protein, partial [Bacteroides sp. OttesenSCG-928-E20]|nr:tetratricopeptide repeat protein [Bacteroides sp. OttesenSCG-928-E20]
MLRIIISVNVDNCFVILEKSYIFAFMQKKISLTPCISFLLFIFSCYSCTSGKVTDPVLLSADSLMECCADSALALLEGIEYPQEMKRSERALYGLLLTKARDKCLVEHTSDSIMKLVVAYYQQHGNTYQKMESLYYLASVYRDLGDAPRALDYFGRAADASKDQTEYRLLGLIYSQMGTLFFYQNLHEEGVKAYLPDSARDYYLKALNDGNLYIKEGVKRVESLYSYSHVASENNRLLLANNHKKRIIYGGISLFLMGIWFFYFRWKKAKEKAERVNRLHYLKTQEYKTKIESYNKEIGLLKKQLEQVVNVNDEREKYILQDKLGGIVEEQTKLISIREDLENAFRYSTIYQRIHNASKDIKFEMKEEDWLELQKEIDKAYNNFTSQLYSYYPGLKQNELRVSLLVKSNVANNDIATLLHLGANTISTIRARLFEKIYGEKGKAKDFDSFILGL